MKKKQGQNEEKINPVEIKEKKQKQIRNIERKTREK